jgi:hypothetical protein
MNVIFSFPYADFCANDQPVFGTTLKDGSTQANLLIGQLDKIVADFGEKKVATVLKNLFTVFSVNSQKTIVCQT